MGGASCLLDRVSAESAQSPLEQHYGKTHTARALFGSAHLDAVSSGHAVGHDRTPNPSSP